jgi:hypothetical protein
MARDRGNGPKNFTEDVQGELLCHLPLFHSHNHFDSISVDDVAPILLLVLDPLFVGSFITRVLYDHCLPYFFSSCGIILIIIIIKIIIIIIIIIIKRLRQQWIGVRNGFKL